MSRLLDLCYLVLLLVVSPWLIYAAIRKGKYREGWAAKLLGSVPARSGQQPCLWMHAVSVGEVNLLRPLIDRWRQRYPQWELVISTTTKSGYDLARQKYSSSTVFYCPLDFSWAVARAMRRIRPRLLLLAELELWPNLIAAARGHGAQVAVVNGRLSQHSARGYRRAGWLMRRVLRSLDLIAVQNEEYAQRFRELGASARTVVVTGSLKFDGAQTDRNNPRTTELARLAGIDQQDRVFLAGSTQAPEEDLAVQTFRQLVATHPRLRLILVPRHPERFAEVARMLDRSGLAWERRSQLTPDRPATSRILLVDAVGELGSWWGRADIGFVGGSMGTRGGQNMIEPAAYGVAVCFGPNTHNFRDVVQLLLERQAAVVVRDGQELTNFVQACLEGQPRVQPLGARARQLVGQHLGATERTTGLLERLTLQQLPAGAGTQLRRHDAESIERPTTIPSDAVVPQGRVRL